MCRRQAFTLIELLIVVAIIAILAAIAVPNFLEAQTRSKVSRVKADMRSVATALEAYAVDNNSYPTGSLGDRLSRVHRLSTPIAYMTSVSIEDPFTPDRQRRRDIALLQLPVAGHVQRQPLGDRVLYRSDFSGVPLDGQRPEDVAFG